MGYWLSWTVQLVDTRILWTNTHFSCTAWSIPWDRDNWWVFLEACFIKEIRFTACVRGCICPSPIPVHRILGPVACLPSNLTDGKSLRDGKLFCRFHKNRYFARVKRSCMLLHWGRDWIGSHVRNQTPRGDVACPSFTDGFIATPETRNVYL